MFATSHIWNLIYLGLFEIGGSAYAKLRMPPSQNSTSTRVHASLFIPTLDIELVDPSEAVTPQVGVPVPTSDSGVTQTVLAILKMNLMRITTTRISAQASFDLMEWRPVFQKLFGFTTTNKVKYDFIVFFHHYIQLF